MTRDPAQLRHDLRTPLNHIIGYSELLGEELEERGVEGLDQDLQRIRSAALSLRDLIAQEISGADFMLPEVAETIESPDPAKPALTGRLLIVDDDETNRDMLARYLVRQGHSVRAVAGGEQALELLAGGGIDVVLLDMVMPGMDGLTTLREMKSSPILCHLPVVMISALDEIGSVARCIQAGAEDYLPKPFNPTILRARIGACLEKKRLRDSEQEYLRTIEETRRRLAAEMAQAAAYVRSILPGPTSKPFRIDWSYAPSTELGGDGFGYHWIDDDHFALYLLDVCGHGVGASLLAVSVINMIRSGAMPEADLREPKAVLAGLNATFRMEEQNNMYFTVWYGVFQKSSRVLRHASGGHPPALLRREADAIPPTVAEINSLGPIIGILPGAVYPEGHEVIPRGACLFLISDGTYEIRRPDGSRMDLEDLKARIATNCPSGTPLGTLLEWVQSVHGDGPLDDDFSVVRVEFP